MIIHNNDDVPLVINDIGYLQLNSYLVSDMNVTKSYYLAYSNDSIAAPIYDLAYFRNEIPEELPEVTLSDLRKVPIQVLDDMDSPLLEQAPVFYERKAFIWVVIGAVALLLGYMSTRMLAEMRNNE